MKEIERWVGRRRHPALISDPVGVSRDKTWAGLTPGACLKEPRPSLFNNISIKKIVCLSIINKEDKFLVGDMILKFEPKENKELQIIRMITKRHPQK